ncbi:hypothetical protein NQ318_013861 [Aromia moschata]|uniref:Uncharacterized protein n=1 Tax=Aromia moschata TaxID=1265417 RepID=A0AAV8ZB10_9CUCU|nr:hypothetical protein NQ318_013861 [Aromia moschata]
MFNALAIVFKTICTIGDFFYYTPGTECIGHNNRDSSTQKKIDLGLHMKLKFLIKLGKTFTEAYAILKEVYGN